MAIRKRGARYQVYWTNPFTKKREAQACATLQDAEKLDAQIKYKLVYEREDFRPAAGVEEPPAAKANTLEEVHYLYLKEKQFGKRCLSSQLGAMRMAYTFFASTPIGEITAAQLEEYKRCLEQKDLSTGTIRNRMSLLHSIFRWAQRHGMLESLPEFPQLPPADYEHFVPPNRSELTRMIAVAAEHIKRVIILGSQLGGRVGPCELFRLRWDDVDFDRGIVRMPSANKNRREPWREIPIRTSLRRMLEEWQASDSSAGIDFVIHYHGAPIERIKMAWAATLRRAGITRRIRPYDLRHYFATEMIAAGIDLGTVANLMGHTSTDMLTQHYQHVLTRQKRAAVEALPDVPSCAKRDVPKRIRLLDGHAAA